MLPMTTTSTPSSSSTTSRWSFLLLSQHRLRRTAFFVVTLLSLQYALHQSWPVMLSSRVAMMDFQPSSTTSRILQVAEDGQQQPMTMTTTTMMMILQEDEQQEKQINNDYSMIEKISNKNNNKKSSTMAETISQSAKTAETFISQQPKISKPEKISNPIQDQLTTTTTTKPTTAITTTKTPATTTDDADDDHDKNNNNNVTVRVFSASLIDQAKTRHDRFPTIEERVKLYMGDWYLPPCDRNGDAISFRWINETAVSLVDHFDGTPITSFVRPDTLFVYHKPSIEYCQRATNHTNRNMIMYCQNVIDRMMPIVDDTPTADDVPILLQFGDKRTSLEYYGTKVHTVPHFKKFRYARTHDEINNNNNNVVKCRQDYSNDKSSLQPIIWKLEIERHYGLLSLVQEFDVPWKDKINTAIFRGQPTGARANKNSPNITSDIDHCRSSRRCRLVYDNNKNNNKTAEASKVDVLLTRKYPNLPEVLSDGTRIVGPKMNVTKLLRYKAIVMLEGNDIASGLKWALYSNSVVLMPKPVYTSWAMEELLEEWVHYIPIDEYGSNLEQRMKWIIANDKKARAIAVRGKLWIKDLMQEEDSIEVEKEQLRRYRMHYVNEAVVVSVAKE